MAKDRVADALSHWQKPFDGFQTSALDFYTAVENGLKEREIPDIKFARVKFEESGLVSAQRIYLRVKRKGLVFDVGAAPFGTGYFFSWWLAEKRPSWITAVLFLALLIVSANWSVNTILHVLERSPLARFIYSPTGARSFLPDIVLYLLCFVLVRRLGRSVALDVDALISALPLIGPAYRWAFVRETYYSIDTMLMFQSLVSGVVTEVIDKLTTAKGLRALTEDEKKPIMRDFLKRAR